MKLSAKVYVTLKPGVLDPAGKAIEHALHTLGFAEAHDVRLGKYIELNVDADSARVLLVTRGLTHPEPVRVFALATTPLAEAWDELVTYGAPPSLSTHAPSAQLAGR